MMVPYEKSLLSDLVTVSVGVTTSFVDYNLSYDDLFEVVDKALYLARDAGRNQVKYSSL